MGSELATRKSRMNMKELMSLMSACIASWAPELTIGHHFGTINFNLIIAPQQNKILNSTIFMIVMHAIWFLLWPLSNL